MTDQLSARVNDISNSTIEIAIAIDVTFPVDNVEKFETIEVISKASPPYESNANSSVVR